MKIIERKITDVIDTDYKEFAMYTLEARAIPSAIDGMKPVNRKLLYAMLNDHGGSKTKVSEISIAKHNYHHGESSSMGATIMMAADWCNNAPLFTGHGAFGSRMINDSAAPRYIYVSLSENYKKFFSDAEIAPKSNDPENPEPRFYLPLIPWVLVNGVSGMSVGYKADILPRAVSDLVKATKECLKNPDKFLATNAIIMPSYPHFSGGIESIGNNQYRTTGKIEYIGKNQFSISELPMGYDRESYIGLLNKLVDDDKIKDYDDGCSRSGFGFTIKVSLAQKAEIEKDPITYFKLAKTHTEILTTLGHDGKLKIFSSVAELIHYFVQFRLEKTEDKINYDIQKLSDQIVVLNDKIKFINAVLDGHIDFKKMDKQDVLTFIERSITTLEHGKRFLATPLYECTKDAVKAILERSRGMSEELEELKNLTAYKLYSDRLNKIKV